MAIYRYKNSPLIDCIEIHTLRSGIARATIVIKENTNVSEIEKLREILGADQFATLMDTEGKRAVIQVRGLKDPKALFESLGKIGISPASATKEKTPDDDSKISTKDKIRDKSLFLSAIFYDLGNIALIISGIQRGRHNPDGFALKDFSEIGTGLAFSVGDVLMTCWGKDKGDEELKVVDKDLKRHLIQKGIDIPQIDTLNADSLFKSGAHKETSSWIRDHMVQIKCLSELAGGLLMMHSGSKRTEGKVNRGQIAAGAMISTAWLSTLLLDKHPAERILDGDKPPSTLGERIVDNPRAWIARPLAMANNVLNLWGVYNHTDGKKELLQEGVAKAKELVRSNDTPTNRKNLLLKQRGQHDYIWMVLTSCSFLVAHTLFGISGSKRPRETEDDKAVMNDLVLLSANVLAKQPEKVSNAAIDETAEFVSKLAHVKMTKEQVADAIRGKVADLAQSTWVARTSAPPSSLDYQLTV